MAVEENDYRLEYHKDYLQAATLRWSPYMQPSASWDHDHCEFCYQRFAEPTSHYTDAEFSGYRAVEGQRDWWVCPQCADDLKEHYSWTIVGGPKGTPEK